MRTREKVVIAMAVVAALVTTANAAGKKKPNAAPKGFLDAPVAGDVQVNARTMGWALDEDGKLKSVDLLLDGKPLQKLKLDADRPDVCAKFAVAACPKVGFNTVLDLSKVKKGKHTLVLQLSDDAGTKVKIGERAIVVQ